MKSNYLVPAATALVGFSIAWLAKPSGSTAPPSATVEEAAATRPARTELASRPSAANDKRPKEVKASDFPLADQADQGPKTRDEAKMLRLTEALGLSIDQQGEIISLIEGVQATASTTAPVIEDLQTRGKAIEEGLMKLLTPEQLAKFEELRVRERENRIEVRSQKLLSAAIEEIDLSPEQREQVLERLRQKSKAELQEIPAAATLLFDKSMLPTAGKELTADGVLMLARMNEPFSDDPAVARQKLIEQQRGELEELLKCFDGILTQGQIGQYHAALAETREAMKRLPRAPEVKPQPAPAAVPESAPEPPFIQLPEILPDDEDEGTENEAEAEMEGDE